MGEDSTCYLASPYASARIALQEKPIRTVICLRHPTDRAYSQYWHMLWTGRAVNDFDDTVRFQPHIVLWRSLYVRHLQSFLRHIARERVFFFVLEEYQSDREGVMKSLLAFLGVPPDELPRAALLEHANRGMMPVSIRLQLVANRLLRGSADTRYVKHLPFVDRDSVREPALQRFLYRVHQRLNRAHPGTPPPMNPATRMYLDSFFRREMSGLDELVGRDVTGRWFARPRRG